MLSSMLSKLMALKATNRQRMVLHKSKSLKIKKTADFLLTFKFYFHQLMVLKDIKG